MQSLEKLRELRRHLNQQERLLREAEKRAGVDLGRQRDALRKREERSEGRVVIIPRCANLDRRLELEADDIAWLRYYFGPDSGVPDPFVYEFPNHHLEMIEAFANAIKYGGDQSVHAPRGEGKTTFLERLTIKYTLMGVLTYTVLFQATGTLAANSLDTIKSAFQDGDNVLLAEDYPEVCTPVASLGGIAQRANTQLVSGFRHDNGEPFEMCPSKFTWCGQEIIFPKVPGSPSSQAIIATRGLDAAVRGLKKKGRRPQLAAIDDPDTENTARSEEQAKKLEDRIEKAIGGLGSQTRPIARIMLTTIQSRISVSYKFTDPEQKPSWQGKRLRYLLTPPDRLDLWEEFIGMQQDDWRNKTHHAHDFYVANQEEMDRGAVVANPHRRAEGQISALEHYYVEVAKRGQEAVSTEYDGDPPEIQDGFEDELTARAVQFRLSMLDRGCVPSDAVMLVRGIDVGKYRLHWVVKAITADASFYVIDYGVKETHGAERGTDAGTEFAIRQAIRELKSGEDVPEYRRPEIMQADGELLPGELVPISLTLVDSRYFKEGVIAGCRDNGDGWFPSMGHGKSNGCVSTSFRSYQKATDEIKPFDGGYLKYDAATGAWIVHADTDRWKEYEHERWKTPMGKPGAAYIFGSMTDEEKRWADNRLPRDVKEHGNFSKHIVAESLVEIFNNGILQRKWKTKAGYSANHYLDASYLCNVAAALRGIRLMISLTPDQETPRRPAVISPGKTRTARW